MIFLHIVLAIAALAFVGGFINASFDSRVSEDAMIGLGVLSGLTLLMFAVSFLK